MSFHCVLVLISFVMFGIEIVKQEYIWSYFHIISIENNINLSRSISITVLSEWAWWHLKLPASQLFTQTVYSGADLRKHKSSTSLAFVRGIHQWLVISLHKGPVTRKMFLFDDVIMSDTWVIIGLVWLAICMAPNH